MRASGILLHITSLPSAFGIGDFGREAYRFVELLTSAKQHYWSILPLSPTRLEDANSPYQTYSAFAGNPLLISPEILIEDCLLRKEQVRKVRPSSRVDFGEIYREKEKLLQKAYGNFTQSKNNLSDAPFSFEDFCSLNENWLNDYALYVILRQNMGAPWHKWPSPLRNREPQAMVKKQSALKEEINRQKFNQYLFFCHFSRLKLFCRAKQIQIIGDMPFYVTHDSADVWVHRELFSLKSKGEPKFVSGVPPDYFSAEGQLWGNPTYNWKKMEQTNFQWWMERIRHNLLLFDKLRLDHFRGFMAFWQVPAGAKTAKVGQWVKTPSDAFFKALKTNFPSLPFIAEDLGYIDEPVKAAIRHLGIPGMRVLLFSFDGDRCNPHLPKNHDKNAIVYTGTHDTNTAKGWFTHEASYREKQRLLKVLGKKIGAKQVSLELVKTALASRADLSIIPLQDILGLGKKARMNNPGSTSHNWEWRALPKQIGEEKFAKLREITVECHR